MFIIAGSRKFQVEPAMLDGLGYKMIERFNAGVDIVLTGTVKI
jgi:hypothetical protein